jgi:hypothetical protein
MESKPVFVDEYEESIHKTGKISGIIGVSLIIMVPVIICLKYNIFPPLKNLLSGILSIWMIEIPICISEVLTYCPMLGSGGSYLAFISGNLTNLKIPCASMCMDAAGVKPSTKEGDIISTISIAASTIVTEVIIIIGVIAIVPLTPILNSKTLAPAFQNILPALFGALGVYWIAKQWKLAVVPLVTAIVISYFVNVPIAILIPVCGLVSIAAARYMYKKDWVRSV